MKSKLKYGIGVVMFLVVATMFAGCGESVDKLMDVKKQAENIVNEKGSIVDGLKGAISNGVAMKCVSAVEGEDFVSYTNGKNVRSEVTIGGKEVIALVKDSVTYTWTKGEKTGQKMDMNCLGEINDYYGMDEMDEGDDVEEGMDIESLEAEEAAGNVTCTPSTEGDFSIPSDVKFVDQCEMIKEQTSKMNTQIKTQMEGVDPEMKKQIEAMMNK